MSHSRHQRKAFGRLLQKRGAGRFVKMMDGASVVAMRLGQLLAGSQADTSPRQLLPLKHIRLAQLVEAGFNCADFRSWPRGELNLQELEAFYRRHGSISLRNFTEEDPSQETPKLPVLYDMHDWDSIAGFCALHNSQYHTLVNQALPVKDSLMAGNIILLDSWWYTVACFEGYGTPRDVDDRVSQLKIYQRRFGEESPGWVPNELRAAISGLQNFERVFRPMTVEFSVYPYPVGVYQSSVVLWEWRGGSAHDLHTAVARLLSRSRHDLDLRFPASHSSLR